MITDGEWVCSRCLDYKTGCNLCGEGMADLIPTTQYIKDEEKALSEKLMPSRTFPIYH